MPPASATRWPVSSVGRCCSSTAFGSIGILRYEGSLAPSRDQPLGYFDKVDLLVGAQDVTLAVWGMLRRSGDTISIDVYAQVPPRVVDESFSWTLRLPEAMGARKLVAHLRPARMRVEHREMAIGDARALADIAHGLDTLLAEPKDGASVVTTLPVGSVYWISRRQGDWVEISTDTRKGWVRSAGFCVGACAPLLDAAHFASGLLEFIESRRIPEVAATLANDAQAVRTQLSVLEQLDTLRPGTFEPNVVRPVARWLDSAPDGSLPPGGAAFANIKALAQMATSVQAAIALRASDDPLERRFNAAKVEPSRVRQIAFELARASVSDPRNVDVLEQPRRAVRLRRRARTRRPRREALRRCRSRAVARREASVDDLHAGAAAWPAPLDA